MTDASSVAQIEDIEVIQESLDVESPAIEELGSIEYCEMIDRDEKEASIENLNDAKGFIEAGCEEVSIEKLDVAIDASVDNNRCNKADVENALQINHGDAQKPPIESLDIVIETPDKIRQNDEAAAAEAPEIPQYKPDPPEVVIPTQTPSQTQTQPKPTNSKSKPLRPTPDKIRKQNSTNTQASTTTRRMYNILNFLGYALTLTTTYLGSLSKCWYGGTPFVELTSQYQTLITPSAVYFDYIWGMVFLSQGFFVACQILPRYYDHILVQNGVGMWYFLICASQSAWSVAFGYEYMIPAFVCMVALYLGLMIVLNRQWGIIEEYERKKEDPWLLANNAVSAYEEENEEKSALAPSFAYWLLRFPFAVHAGWIASVTPMMLSVVLLAYGASTQVELWTAVMSLAILFGMSMGLLLRQDKGAPSYVFPAVVAYAFAGIAWELYAPSDAILSRFQDGEINMVKNVAGFCGAMILVTIVSRFFAILMRDHCCNRYYEDDEDDNVIYVEADGLDL